MDALASRIGQDTIPSAEGARWASFGPYYAMFPVSFAREVIAKHTRLGDAMLDPFAGRGTSLFCALESNRAALGIELNPLGWIYGRTKLFPSPVEQVVSRIGKISKAAKSFAADADQLPKFFHLCYAPRVRSFLLAARSLLRWRSKQLDRTAMAFILVHLHGKIERSGRPSALSNQMRQTKAMAPDYSIKWWRENRFETPPDLDPASFLIERILWRYAKGAPAWNEEAMQRGDCRSVMQRKLARDCGRFSLMFTSPPYRGVTSYYYDQWLRFWLLGDAEHPVRNDKPWKTKFEGEKRYAQLILQSFAASRRLLSKDAVIYVRIDARPESFNVTRAALEQLFRSKRMNCVPAPYTRATQTALFGDRASKPGEMDIILTP